jgi:hypothetical protein
MSIFHKARFAYCEPILWAAPGASSSCFSVKCGTFEPESSGWSATSSVVQCIFRDCLSKLVLSISYQELAGCSVFAERQAAPRLSALRFHSFGFGPWSTRYTRVESATCSADSDAFSQGRSADAFSTQGVQQIAAGTAICAGTAEGSCLHRRAQGLIEGCIGFWRSGPAQRRDKQDGRTEPGIVASLMSKADPSCLPSRSVVSVERSRVR